MEETVRILRNGKKMSREPRTILIQFKIVDRIYWNLLVKDRKAASASAPSLWHTSLSQLAALECFSYRLLDKVEKYGLKLWRYH